MGAIIHMAEYRTQDTKRHVYEHGGQRYTCTFDPNAPKGEQWVWHMDYVRTYRYFGSSATLGAASVAARKKIHSLNLLAGD